MLPDRLERFNRPEFTLRSGTGKGVNGYVDVCAMQAVSWLAGYTNFSDSPLCVCPVIRHYIIRLNDSWLFDGKHRGELKPFLPRTIGTIGSGELSRQRGFIATDFAVRRFAPMWMRFLKREDWAAELEAVGPVTDRGSATLAQDVARKIKAAADADADAAAYAAAYAAAAADAAAAAYAAAYAAAAVAAAAYAATTAYAYAYAATTAYAAAAACAAAAAAAAVDADADAAAAAYAEFLASLRSAALECLEAMIGCRELAALEA